MSASDDSSKTVSDVFDLPSSDLSLRSVDGIIFKVHRNKLTANSDIFEGMFESSHDDGHPIQLTERADILEGFLRFFYGDLYPVVDSWSLEFLTDMAECSYKYEVALIRDVIHRVMFIR